MESCTGHQLIRSGVLKAARLAASAISASLTQQRALAEGR